MTEYTPADLNEDWEFKIVRASTPVFRNPERLRQLVEEEARAGWVLLEKFDDRRVRFKRPASAREKDAWLPPDVDPYRTQIGAFPIPTPANMAFVVVAVVLALALAMSVLAFMLTSGS